MSFAGHVYDMIRRNKENRELLSQLRDRTNKARKKNIEMNQPSANTKSITLEDIERICGEAKEWEQQRQQRAYRITLIIAGILVIAILGILAIILFII